MDKWFHFKKYNKILTFASMIGCSLIMGCSECDAATAYSLEEADSGDLVKYSYNETTKKLETQAYNIRFNSDYYALTDGFDYEDYGIPLNINNDKDDIMCLYDLNPASIDNGVVTGSYTQYGLALNNQGITQISDVIFKNCNSVASNTTSGGAIYISELSNDIDKITGGFLENSNLSNADMGGAIYINANAGKKINNINGFFVKNVAADGAAIYNAGQIGNIHSDFLGNKASETQKDVHNGFGGAIYNANSIGTISSNAFVGNSSYSYDSDSKGGAIYNAKNGSIENVNSDFIGNFAFGINGLGGAIYNETDSNISKGVQSDFIYNYVKGDVAQGGAIYNSSNATINAISGIFMNNSANAENTAKGGAIYNEGTLNSIVSDFTGNYVEYRPKKDSDYDVGNSKTILAYGGAIYNNGLIKDIQGNFDGNYIKGKKSGTAQGAAIYNEKEITSVKGNFRGNYLDLDFASESKGGAIYNKGSFSTIGSNFIQNKINSIDGKALGGAIYNEGTINNIDGKNTDGKSITFYNNSVTSQSENAYGGAIYNEGTIGNIINTNFTNNYAVSTNGEAKGGAIYTTKDLNITADAANIEFSGNYTQSGNTKTDNAIYVDSIDATLNFNLKNGGSITLKDSIDGQIGEPEAPSLDFDFSNFGKPIFDESTGTIHNTPIIANNTTSEDEDAFKSYTVNITGDDKDKTTFYMLNQMNDATLGVSNTTINTVNNNIDTYTFYKFTINGDINLVADVDLKNEVMDTISASEYGTHNGTINVSGLNLITDSDKHVASVEFGEEALKDYVESSLDLTTVLGPIYTYQVEYEDGEFVFTKGSKKTTSSSGKHHNSSYTYSDDEDLDEDLELEDSNTETLKTAGGAGNEYTDYADFNPAIVSSLVATQVGIQTTMSQTYQEAFSNTETFMQMPKNAREALMEANRYAIASPDYNENMQYRSNDMLNSGIWFKPYTSFEDMPLKNGPKSHVVSYGAIVGYDSNFRELKHGWRNVGSGYIGYNGNVIKYSGLSTTMNGGLIGGTESFYKGNFWSAVTLAAGASVGETNTMYGKEDYTTLYAGIGSKTGYNIELKDGKIIIQPNMLISYTFGNTFDYTNAAGVRIDSDPMHTLQLNPNIRIMGNSKGGWQPYFTVGMVWNLLNETKARANGEKLPEMHVKPYVEYGLGIQKKWKENMTAYGQAMIRNGGRNGIALTAGFRWSLGKDNNKYQKL
jgi:hypothetical protein